MMNKIIALLAMTFLLSACGVTRTTVDAAPENTRDDAIDATGPQVTADDSGLGTIAYNEKTRAPTCKRRRKTGSHLYTTDCSGSDSGSRPVRNGDWNSLGRYVVTGSVRPD
jgi:hypothetical protein